MNLSSGVTIKWDMWRKVFEWDKGNVLRVYPNLRKDHIDLTQASKMRNHLAEEAMNYDMLNLFEEYKKTHADGILVFIATIIYYNYILNRN